MSPKLPAYVIAGGRVLIGAGLLVAPALWHVVTLGDGSEPSPVDPGFAFLCAAALLVLVPIAGLRARARRHRVATWTCVVIGMATALFWASQIKLIFFGPWPT